MIDEKRLAAPTDGSPEAVRRLVGEVQALAARACRRCGAALCGHQALFSLMMGFKDAPVCAPCLAASLGLGLAGMRDELLAHVRRRVCFTAGWKWASESEGGNPAEPACLWRDVPAGATAPSAAAVPSSAPPHDEDWDAGDLGCGDLVLELRGRMTALRPGQVLRILSLDPGAPEDLPSWCRLTGHALVAAKHPLYWIRKKEA